MQIRTPFDKNIDETHKGVADLQTVGGTDAHASDNLSPPPQPWRKF